MNTRVGKSLPLGSAGAVLLFVASAAGVAIAISLVAWRFLPYETLERYTPADRFFVWEGVVWLFALVSIFLAAAVILEVQGWRVRAAIRDLAAEFRTGERDGVRVSPAILPWWVLACGLTWLAIGVLARSVLAP